MNEHPKEMIAAAKMLYLFERKEPIEIQKKTGIHVATIRRWIKKFEWNEGIEARFKKESPEIVVEGFANYLKIWHPKLSKRVDETIAQYLKLLKEIAEKPYSNL